MGQGYPTGGALQPGRTGSENTITQEGPLDQDGFPQFTITETRESQQKFGEPPRHTRKFRATQEIIPGRTTLRSDVVKYINATKNSPHPEFPGCICTELTLSETVEDSAQSKKFITEITAVYTVPDTDEPDAHPLAQPDTWSFQTQGSSIAALYYFDANGDILPLTNSAGDYIKGLEGDEAQTKVIIKGNRASFPSALATALTNCVNGDAFLGGAPDHWKCQGISGQLKYESVDDIVVRYWEFTIELMYRQTGWNLLIPDVGFNFIANNQKRRAMVFDDQNKEWIASADPVALDGNGNQAAAGAAPAVLDRRIYRRVNFSTYFGTPPF